VDDVVCEDDEDVDEMKKRSDKVEWYVATKWSGASSSRARFTFVYHHFSPTISSCGTDSYTDFGV
jgi:hypothetical protein